MIEQKRQQIAAMMDDDVVSDDVIEQLVRDPEMRSMWSRFHLVRDLIQKDVPEAIDPQLESRIFSALSTEPTILVPAARKANKSFTPASVITNIRDWTEQATGFAIAASVTAMMVYGVQTLQAPSTSFGDGHSAITALEFLEVDELQIAEQPVYSELQEDLLDFTRTSSQYGLKAMGPYASVVNHSITVPLTLIKSNFDTILEETEVNDEKTQSNTEQTEK